MQVLRNVLTVRVKIVTKAHNWIRTYIEISPYWKWPTFRFSDSVQSHS